MSFTSRLAGAAALAAVAFAPAVAFAGDDFSVYTTRSAFESALGTSYTTTPGASGVTFTTSGAATAPITYAVGAAGNLFGTSESIGYTNTSFFSLGAGSLNMALPSGLTAFGFDYAYNPTISGEGVTFGGTFCNFFVCDDDTYRSLAGGPGFIGIVANGGVETANVSGWARNVQVANLTFAGSVTATPEPATIALMATGLLALGGMGVARRRRNEG